MLRAVQVLRDEPKVVRHAVGIALGFCSALLGGTRMSRRNDGQQCFRMVNNQQLEDIKWHTGETPVHDGDKYLVKIEINHSTKNVNVSQRGRKCILESRKLPAPCKHLTDHLSCPKPTPNTWVLTTVIHCWENSIFDFFLDIYCYMNYCACACTPQIQSPLETGALVVDPPKHHR